MFAALALAGAVTTGLYGRLDLMLDPTHKRAIVVLAAPDQPACKDIDMSGTIWVNPPNYLLSLSLVSTPKGRRFYVIWTIDATGVHHVYRAIFYLDRCVLSEKRYQEETFRKEEFDQAVAANDQKIEMSTIDTPEGR